MVCIRVGVRGFALKETQRGIAHYYIVYLKDKHTTIKCIKKEGYREDLQENDSNFNKGDRVIFFSCNIIFAFATPYF